MGKAIEAIEQPKAKERKKRKPKSVVEKGHNKKEAKTRDKVGESVGMSGRTTI